MKRILKCALCLMLCAVMTLALCGPAGAVTASERGLVAYRNKSYNQDGKYCLSYSFDTGKLPGGENTKTVIRADLYNSSGKRVVYWDDKEYASNSRVKRDFGYNWNDNLPSGSYTMKVKATLCGEQWVYNGYSQMPGESFEWTVSLNHTQPAKLWLDSTQLVTMNDGSYSNKIIFGHQGAKGKQIRYEIYDEWNNLVFTSANGNAISYTSGTYYFYWNGFPSSGGAQCGSGNYKIKYWLIGGSAKQSSAWLDIY